ncbi:MAG: hypothetical protein M1292_12735 [Bacteroidetes bacterium]|nr:hypothetical protein [Bacteroidota bacterium]
MYGLSAKQWVYVSPKGDDRNIGTRDQPLASLAGARDRFPTILRLKVKSKSDQTSGNITIKRLTY